MKTKFLGVAALFLTLVPSIAMASTITINQAPPNFTLSTAQPISPLFFPPGYSMTNVLGNGTEDMGNLGFYAINVLSNDTLHLVLNSTTSPLRPTELQLYDQNQNLVAVAAGNGSDGLRSIIDYTTFGGAGIWYAEVLLSFSDTDTSPYTYVLSVQGATGLGPVNQTPLPAALPLFATGLGVLGLLGWRRKRKAAVPVAA